MMAKYDLTSTIGEYLDRHLVFPLLEFLTEKKIYDETDLLRGKLDLLSNTNMVDFAVEVHNALYGSEEAPEELRQKRNEVVAQLKALRAETDPVCQIFLDPDVQTQMKNARDVRQLVEFLREKYDFKLEMIDTIYNFAKFQYDCGKYEGAAEYLGFYRMLVSSNDKSESYPTKQYLNAIQTMCPHILRYLAAAVITNKQHRRTVMKDLVKVIQQESYTYRDPITEFLEHLYAPSESMSSHVTAPGGGVHLFCPSAQPRALQSPIRRPADCVVRCFVLSKLFPIGRVELRHNAPVEGTLRVCLLSTPSLFLSSMLAEKLNMERTEAEHWIVNLIRQAHLDAKIDSKAGHVVMDIQAVSPYHQLIEKTKQLSIRTQMQSLQIEKRLSAMKPVESTSTWGAPEWGAAH
ncbi:unnamed protein product [Cyprideis torosa]|uniref:Eukaryotic translation initiation factor 3 subunit E n=1 Tax=Cyprideis torosa TaxID=163714 RepID=A0A7R8W763_9CRUS|nr:unnamed protein product [Cyprideis torosa]CAG0885950.1 unnamed protein product [Cyprideis torosa]